MQEMLTMRRHQKELHSLSARTKIRTLCVLHVRRRERPHGVFCALGYGACEGTLEYAGQFPAEERAIYYITDEARVYEIENGTDNTIKNSAVISDTSSVKIGKNAANEVVLTINSSVDADILLGYEITRIMYENGQEVREVAGFAVPDAGASAAEWKIMFLR